MLKMFYNKPCLLFLKMGVYGTSLVTTFLGKVVEKDRFQEFS
jgi:hypothetical protein